MTRLNTIALVARAQRRAALSGARGLVFLAFWAVLVALAAWTGGTAAIADRQHHATTLAAERKAYADWLSAYEGDWRPVFMTANSPLVAAKPPAPARALAGGVEDAGGAWAGASRYHIRELEGRKADLSPLGALLGSLDLAGLVAVAGALAAIALGHDAVSGERERGTLALHFANPLGRGDFLAGKAWGSLQALALALGVPLAVAIGALLAVGALSATPGGLARAAAFWGLAMIYMAFWCVAAVAASVLARSSATAFVALAGVWLALAIGVPKLAMAAATHLQPVASPAQLEQRLAEALQASKGHYKELVAAHRDAHGGDRPTGPALARIRRQYVEHYYRGAAPIVEAHRRDLTRRAAWLERLAAVSPAYTFQVAASEVAGTDAERHAAFLQAANGYARALKLEVEQRVLRGQDSAPTLAELPRLAFTERSLAEALSRLGARLAALAIAVALGFVVAWGAFRRYDLRVQAA
jgi:ABC-2 type transport system permease protein